MKFGPRKPNFKKRIKARTTGKIKRKVKKSVNPFYGKKGMGWIKDPKKAAYNKVYQQTTFDLLPSLSKKDRPSTSNPSAIGCFPILLLVLSLAYPILFVLSIPFTLYSIRTQKRKKELLVYNQRMNEQLLDIDLLIEESQKIKGLVPFFERIDKLFTLEEAVLQDLKEGVEKERFEKEDAKKLTEAMKGKIENLLKEYIVNYEKASYLDAMDLKTKKGQINNYEASYEDLQNYQAFFNARIKFFIEENWREIK